jgi:hypothetical protein
MNPVNEKRDLEEKRFFQFSLPTKQICMDIFCNNLSNLKSKERF